MPLVTFDDRNVETEGWETIWTGELKGRNTVSLDMTTYSLIKVFAMLYCVQIVYEIDLTKVSPSVKVSGYPYIGSQMGMWINSSNQAEKYASWSFVNTAKTTFYHYDCGYVSGNGYTWNARNNTADYYVYRIDGLK